MASVAVLLPAAVVNVLIAVIESVLWPVFVSAACVGIAVGLVIGAEAATRFESPTAVWGAARGAHLQRGCGCPTALHVN